MGEGKLSFVRIVAKLVSILCFDKWLKKGIDAGYASRLIQFGCEKTVTEALKYGGVYQNHARCLSTQLRSKASHHFLKNLN